MPTFRQSALLRKEEAVSKGEIEKCAHAVHLNPSSLTEARIYYKEAARTLSRVLPGGVIFEFLRERLCQPRIKAAERESAEGATRCA
jgi:hypothetical protein